MNKDSTLTDLPKILFHGRWATSICIDTNHFVFWNNLMFSNSFQDEVSCAVGWCTSQYYAASIIPQHLKNKLKKFVKTTIN